MEDVGTQSRHSETMFLDVLKGAIRKPTVFAQIGVIDSADSTRNDDLALGSGCRISVEASSVCCHVLGWFAWFLPEAVPKKEGPVDFASRPAAPPATRTDLTPGVVSTPKKCPPSASSRSPEVSLWSS